MGVGAAWPLWLPVGDLVVRPWRLRLLTMKVCLSRYGSPTFFEAWLGLAGKERSFFCLSWEMKTWCGAKLLGFIIHAAVVVSSSLMQLERISLPYILLNFIIIFIAMKKTINFSIYLSCHSKLIFLLFSNIDFDEIWTSTVIRSFSFLKVW